MDKLDEFKIFTDNLLQEVIHTAALDDNESFRSHAFTQLMIDELSSAGEILEGQACFYKARGIEISGYGIDQETDSLDLFITIYNEISPPSTVSASMIEAAFKRLTGLLKSAFDGLFRSLEESSPVFDMALSIYEAQKYIDRVRFILLTDGNAKLEYKSEQEFKGLTVTFEIWDILRFFRYDQAGRQPEPILIDFQEDFETIIPCLKAPGNYANYNAYLAILPGTVLNGIYSRYGSRLLELNVRSFLQAKGKVNQGIRKTILEEPEKFLAYNNGISATAQSVELVALPEGGKGIKSIKGLQIVNGGQTTASIYYSMKTSSKVDLSKVFVQVKLTVINDEITLRNTVPLISRYANSQNKVNEADFFANEAFHVNMEKLSRTIWAPATDGTQHQTRWFYERARGQYQDALNREGTPSKIQQFKTTHPTSQRFSKTDLAKFENTWDQYPHYVSLGAQKNFVSFTDRFKKERENFEPDPLFFQRHIARAILFKRAEKIVAEQKFGGYRANIVTYTLALLAHITSSRIDLDKIWADQTISPALTEAIGIASHHVFDSITKPDGHANITEWCKKKNCWEKVKELKVKLPLQLELELVQLSEAGPGNINDILANEELTTIQDACNVTPVVWVEVSDWAKQTGNLLSWQRSLAFSLAKIIALGKKPTFKQAKLGLVLLEEAERLGYKKLKDAS